MEKETSNNQKFILCDKFFLLYKTKTYSIMHGLDDLLIICLHF